jgi:hypothetical protein
MQRPTWWKSVMNLQVNALVVAIAFAAMAVLQLARALVGWPVAVIRRGEL